MHLPLNWFVIFVSCLNSLQMKNLFLTCFILFSVIAGAQDKEKKKKTEPKYLYCYKETSFETDDYKIYFVDAVNVEAKAKFKMRIFNKTNDYLVFKPSELVFKINGQDIPGTDKQMIIMPNDEDSKVIDVKGKGLQEEKYSIEIKSVYKVAANSPPTAVPDFDLPPSKNDFTSGNFNCKLLDHSLKTDKSTVKFGCTYNGDGIGIIDPYKSAAIMPKGKENANSKKYKASLLTKGGYEDFTLEFKELNGGDDMQKNPFKVKWNGTFSESKMNPLSGGKIDFEIDAPKTLEKNK
jgi:hypothetical protein